MWITERPRASSARAASITSITMKGSTSPRLDVRTTRLLGSARRRPSATKRRRAQPKEPRLRTLTRRLAAALVLAFVAAPGPAAALSLIRDAEIEADARADRVSAVPGGGGLAGQRLDLHRRGRRAERLRRRRPEHLRPYRPPDRARLDRPDPCGPRARARPHHRRPPQPARAVAARRARHRCDRHARRRRRRGRRQPGGRASPSPWAPARRRSARRSRTAGPRRRAPTRPACATWRPRAATRRRSSRCSTISAGRTR